MARLPDRECCRAQKNILSYKISFLVMNCYGLSFYNTQNLDFPQFWQIQEEFALSNHRGSTLVAVPHRWYTNTLKRKKCLFECILLGDEPWCTILWRIQDPDFIADNTSERQNEGGHVQPFAPPSEQPSTLACRHRDVFGPWGHQFCYFTLSSSSSKVRPLCAE